MDKIMNRITESYDNYVEDLATRENVVSATKKSETILKEERDAVDMFLYYV